MVLSLKYGDLSGMISESNRLADELGQYCDDLSRKVQQKMYSVEGGMSSALNNADYYVKSKIAGLRAKESNARNLSAKAQTLLETARRVDTGVEQMIQANQQSFFNKNPDLKPADWKQNVVSFFVDLKNANIPILSDIIRGGEAVLGALETLKNNIRHWYKCGGGKELVGVVLSAVGGVLAVVVLVCAVAFTGGTILAVIAGVVGVISAMIGLVNAATNIATSIQAYDSAQGGHPGMAKIYAGQDTLADVLRQTNFHDRELNRGSNAWATGIEITDAVCSIITTTIGGVKAVQALKKINITKTFQSICQPRNALGQFIQGKPSLWNGLKSVALKFNLKDFVLGDLNVKNLSRLSKLPTLDALKAIGGLAKAAKGIVDGIDKVNEGKQTLTQFLANRVVIGLDTSLLKQQVLTTKVQDGVKVRKYSDTNLSAFISAVRNPIDSIGLGKVLTDLDHSGSLSKILGTKGGLVKNVTGIVKSMGTWDLPEVVFDRNGVVVDVKNWDSSSGYFDGLKKLPITPPQLDTVRNISAQTFAMPTLSFNHKFECSYPYFNVKAA